MTDTAAALAPLIGEWTVEAEFPQIGPTGIGGRSAFSWLWEPQFVVQESEVDHPDAPNGHILYAADAANPGDYLQHYFDSRGVARVYRMTFDGKHWTMTRTEADFSPLDFGQRFTAELSDDGSTITGAWEIAHRPGDWQHDFTLTYRRVG